MLVVSIASAQDRPGEAIFKQECALCHGAAGEGKVGPAIKGKANVADVLTKGGLAKAPHTKPMASLTDDQVKAIAAFLK